MEINGQKFWIARRKEDWVLTPEMTCVNDTLRLSSLRPETDWGGTRAQAERLLEICPSTVDGHRHIASIRIQNNIWLVDVVRSGQEAAPARTIFQSNQEIRSLSCGTAGILYVATKEGVWLIDLHPTAEQVFEPFLVMEPNFEPYRLAADPAGGCWVLANNGAIGHLSGRPLPTLARLRFSNETIRPQIENANAPRLKVHFDAPSSSDRSVALAYSSAAGLVVLRWTQGNPAELYFPATNVVVPLPGLAFPYSLRWLDQERIALLYPEAREAAVFGIGTGFVGDYYPLLGGPLKTPFHESLEPGATYQVSNRIVQLQHVSLPTLAAIGTASIAEPFDSGISATTWNRLYLEACIPPSCSIRIYAAASDSSDPASVTDWHPHDFGSIENGTLPRGTWLKGTSEIPFHPGFCTHPLTPDESGLFMVLLQRKGRVVSTLCGRYLHLRAELHGTTRSTPEIFAVRAYAFRYNYAERHLPELYRETNFGPDADQTSATAAPSDFLARFLSLFESYLTPLEDQIANVHLLTRPASVPDESLDWLARWVGVTFDPAFPVSRRREWLASCSDLHRWRGTLPGFALALDIASDGGVSRGTIVIVENFRLRRVLATILGTDFTNEEDPLLPGLEQSGNSIVGDSLILSEQSRLELLALFDSSVLSGLRQETEAVALLSDRLAHRVTVLVHQDIEPVDLGLVRRVAEREKPAHVQLTFTQASLPFLAGITSLVGVDTYIARKPQPGPIRLNHSSLGVWDTVTQRPALDPNFPG
jgi:phage tail-like protein